MSDHIGIGDVVSVYFEMCDAIHHAEVLSAPADTGDCWTLKTKDRTYAVQSYSYMVKEDA